MQARNAGFATGNRDANAGPLRLLRINSSVGGRHAQQTASRRPPSDPPEGRPGATAARRRWCGRPPPLREFRRRTVCLRGPGALPDGPDQLRGGAAHVPDGRDKLMVSGPRTHLGHWPSKRGTWTAPRTLRQTVACALEAAPLSVLKALLCASGYQGCGYPDYRNQDPGLYPDRGPQ